MPATIKTEQGPVRITAEIGRSALSRSGGVISEEFQPDLRGSNAIKVYEEMRRNEPTIAVGLNAIKWVLGQVNWEVQPGGETPADAEAAGFLQSCLDDMSHTWLKVIRDALTCLDFGWGYLEVVYKQRTGQRADPPSRYDDGRFGWRKFVLIGHSSLSRWDIDETGGIRGLYQVDYSAPSNGRTSAFGEIFVPIEKSILFRLDDEKNSPEGVSLLRSVYMPWFKKKNIEEIEAIGIERDLTGILVIHPPEGATDDDRTKAMNLLEQYKLDDMTGFYAPRLGSAPSDAWLFEILSSPGSKSIDTNQVVSRYQFEMARGFLVQFLLLGQGQTGSWALARDQHDLFTIALGAILQNLADTLNRFAVAPLFRLNDFGQLTAIPQLRPGRIAKADMDRFSKAMQTLTSAGLLTPGPDIEAFVRSELDLPELPEPEKQKPPEEPGEDQGQQATEPAQNTGAMVALYPSPATARELALQGGQPPEDLHVTLVFLGHINELSETAIAGLNDVCTNLARQTSPILADVGGIGRFDGGGDDGEDAVYTNVDAPILPEFRQALVDGLTAAGITHSKLHGFTPHMTLAYIPADKAIPVRRLLARRVSFRTLSLVLGDKRIDLPLSRERAATESDPEPEQAAEPEPAEMPPAYDDDAEKEVDEILRGLRHRATEAAVRSLATPPKRVDYGPELDALRERYRSLMEGLAKDFRGGKIGYEQWVQGSKDRIAENVRTSYKLGLAEGKGLYPPWSVTLTAQERMTADRLVGKQFDYLLKFREDVQKLRAAGEPLTTAVDARAALYGGAGIDSFNAAKLAVEGGRRLRWDRHAQDSCETCLRMAGAVKTADEWKKGGVWPGHQTQCLSNCCCDLGPAE